MIDYLNGSVVLAYRQHLVHFDVEQHLLPAEDQTHEKIIEIAAQDAKVVQITEQKRIYCLAEIGPDDSCVVLEDLTNGSIRFMHLRVNSFDANQLPALHD